MRWTQPAEGRETPTVDIWVAPLDLPAPALERLTACLSGPEQARAGRYRFARDARRFAAAHGWLRHVLGAELGVAPGSVRLTDDAKPRVVGATGLHFNLSHSSGLAVVAVSSCEVGVDVERVEPRVYDRGLVALACSPSEAAALECAPEGERGRAFLQIWTAKEAVLKATGDGLSVPPSSVEVGLTGGPHGRPVHVAGEPGTGPWWVREIQPADNYVGAVAAEGPDWRTRRRTTTDLAPFRGDPLKWVYFAVR